MRRPLFKTTWLLTVLIGAASTMAACAPQSSLARTMTTEVIRDHGSHVFQAPREDVTKATVGALRSLGYEIAHIDAETGTVTTEPRLVRAAAAAFGNQAIAVAYTRRYRVVMREEDGATTVVAEPSMFEGTSDISGQKIWALDGVNGEYALWTQLFGEIEKNLNVTTSKKEAPAAAPVGTQL